MTTTPRLVKPFTQVNTTDGGVPQFDGQIAALQDGGYVVFWTDRSHTYSGGDAVVGQRYDAAGNKVGGEVPIFPPFTAPPSPRLRSRSYPTGTSQSRSALAGGHLGAHR
jgi:hypothetical protein